jgi:lactate racemase
MALQGQEIILPYGAWRKEETRSFSFPREWNIEIMAPEDAPEVSDEDIEKAFLDPIGVSDIAKIFSGRRNAVIVIDDITRPTPLARVLKIIISKIIHAGIASDDIKILIATGAHKPMSREEVELKVSKEICQNYKVIVHDFMGEDIQKVGWIDGGPVYVNKHFLNADLKICLGGILPHSETGFGGASKLIIPGIAGNLSITHLHGALPARAMGCLESSDGIFDRRSWMESVAQKLGVDLAVCVLINSRRQIAGVVVGDIVEAHRKAAKSAGRIGRTELKHELLQNIDILVVNAYPLDTDPIQIGKSLNVAKNLSPKAIVIIDAASDGIFYHGMGMGSGNNFKRMIRNVPAAIMDFPKVGTWARSMLATFKNPRLAFKLSYFTLNNYSYRNYERYKKEMIAGYTGSISSFTSLYVFSENFPDWGFCHRYPKARLFHNWQDLIQTLANRYADKANVLLFPCSPLQMVNIK